MDEFRLLEHIRRQARAGRDHASLLLVPPGDDMAVLRPPTGDLVLGVDQVVGGCHFDPARTSLEAIAHKAVHRSLSDIAAMAARPLAALYAAVLPRDFTDDDARRLSDALHRTSEEAGAVPAGGDVSVHADPEAPMVLSVTVLGLAHHAGSPRRSDARPGDRVCVTGELGGTRDADGGGHHLSFTARLIEAAELREILGPRLGAMIDLSDGLGRDAGHVAEASDVVIEIEAARLPVRAGSDWRGACGDGEDHELLFTVTPIDGTLGGADLGPPAPVNDVPIRMIGHVRATDEAGPGPRVRIIDPDGTVHDGADFGWVHR